MQTNIFIYIFDVRVAEVLFLFSRVSVTSKEENERETGRKSTFSLAPASLRKAMQSGGKEKKKSVGNARLKKAVRSQERKVMRTCSSPFSSGRRRKDRADVSDSVHERRRQAFTDVTRNITDGMRRGAVGGKKKGVSVRNHRHRVDKRGCREHKTPNLCILRCALTIKGVKRQILHPLFSIAASNFGMRQPQK